MLRYPLSHFNIVINNYKVKNKSPLFLTDEFLFQNRESLQQRMVI